MGPTFGRNERYERTNEDRTNEQTNENEVTDERTNGRTREDRVMAISNQADEAKGVKGQTD